MNFKRFDLCLVPFQVNKLMHSQTIWVNEDASEALSQDIIEPECFNQHYSYVSTELASVAGAMDINKSKTYFAERYGGIGVGRNGGGSRTGNIANVQIKGVGPNPLTGKNGDPWYSYGGLNLSDAVAEVIMGTVLGRLLPLGVAKNYGLIATGPNGAYDYHDSTVPRPSWGALLVRSINLRPAHFLRAADFKPEQRMTRDSVRVKTMILNLREELGGDKGFVEYILNFLEKSAKQFAFATAFRIAHGSMSASNLCFDGKWIDLTNCSFLDGGKNYGYIVPFYSEHLQPLEVGFSLFYMYRKVTSRSVDFFPLKRFYFDEFNKNMTQYVLQVFGLEELHTTSIDRSSELYELAGYFQRLIFANEKFVDSWPSELPKFEPISALIASSYLSLVGLDCEQDQRSLNKIFAQLGISLQRFHHLFQCLYLKRFVRLDHDIIYLAIRALKLSLLSSYYYKGRIVKEFHEISRSIDLSETKQFVEHANSYHVWALDIKFKDALYLFSNQNDFIKYERSDHTYSISGFGSQRLQRFSTYSGLMSSLDSSHCQLGIHGFDVRKIINQIGSTINRIENKLGLLMEDEKCI